MIEITSFLLKHLYELMADDYNARHNTNTSAATLRARRLFQQQADLTASRGSPSDGSRTTTTTTTSSPPDQEESCNYQSNRSETTATTTTTTSREQETNQQIVSFLANNHLPDLICETFIELLFICVFLAVSWIFVMIVQLHCHQQASQQPAKLFYCNTKFLSSLMYCNNKAHLSAH